MSAGTNKTPPPIPTTPEIIPTTSPTSKIIQVTRASARAQGIETMPAISA
jgi:hypothetical protein